MHKTLEMLTERAERRGSAKSGNWEVVVDGTEYRYYHWNTLVLEIKGGKMTYYFGISKSDADGLTAMCHRHGINEKFTFRPVNGGFIRLTV